MILKTKIKSFINTRILVVKALADNVGAFLILGFWWTLG
jgi:hypothetical protein